MERLRSTERGELKEDDGQFTPSEISVGRMVLPLIQDLDDARRTIDELAQKSRAAELALDLVPFAALLLDEEGQLLTSNRYAKTMFGGPAVPMDVITAARRALGARGNGTDGVAVPEGGSRFKLRVVPAELHEGDENGGLGVVFLIPADAKLAIDNDRLVSRYGLTPAQARVAILVAQGLSNREVADELGISPQTVHTHMQTILGKTQVSNRAALVAVVLGARFAQRSVRGGE